MNPDGAYSQLIRLQESREEEQKIDRRTSDVESKSRSDDDVRSQM
jgi:ATP-binding cassette, subfamily B (MDR/TAP), member 1